MERRIPNISRTGESIVWWPQCSPEEIIADVISSVREPVPAV
jgi:hypothetical protein